jgi:hypothetical protein
VAQELADLRQGGAGAQQLGGEAVPEDVGSMVRAPVDLGALEGSLGDPGDRAARRKAYVRSQGPQKQTPASGLGPAVTKVGNDGCANVGTVRNLVCGAGLTIRV